jgi:hypothetical protein
MSKNLILIAILLVLMVGCAPGTSVEVDVPSSTVVLTTPGPNPEQSKPDAAGRVAGIVQGLWHGLIAPVTLIGSFFNPNMQMYEVHNNGREYNLGYLFGVALVFLILGLIGGRRR